MPWIEWAEAHPEAFWLLVLGGLGFTAALLSKLLEREEP
jgi:hypothetical protein